MHYGLATSIILHVAILAWALVSIRSTPPMHLPELEPVEVAIVGPDAIVRLKQGDRSAKALEAEVTPPRQQPDVGKRETVKPKQPQQPAQPVAEPEPAKIEPAPKEAAKSEPEPEPKRDPIAEQLAALPPEPQPTGPTPEELQLEQQQRQAEEDRQKAEAERRRVEEAQKKKAEEDRKKAEEEKKRLAAEKKKKDDLKKKQEDAKRLAEAKKREEEKKKKVDRLADIEKVLQNPALADHDPTKQAAAPENTQTPVTPTKFKGPIAGAREGRDNALTSSQRAMIAVMIRQAVSRCWNINAGVPGIEKINVPLEIKLTPEGRLMEPPKIDRRGASGGPLFEDAANSAMRAVELCQPYDLPQEYYASGWRHMILDFQPVIN